MENLNDKIRDRWTRPRTIFTSMFFATFLMLIGFELEIPPALNTIVSTLMGYYFGSKEKKKEIS